MNNFKKLKVNVVLTVAACFMVVAAGFAEQPKDKREKPISIIRYDTIHHPVSGGSGMVVSQRKLASEIGMSVLERGGNAVDAAVAVGYALAVLLPRAGNIGGGGFMLVYLAEQKKVVAIDYREVAPAKADADMYLNEDGSVSQDSYRKGIKAVAVPGTVAGLSHALARYGTMSLSELLKPTIELAESGFVMDYDTASAIATREALLGHHPATRKIFFNGQGKTVFAGELFKQPDLATTLKEISSKGAEAFYKGAVADKIVSQMEKEGGLITHEDLAGYTVEEREPIVGSYRGHKIVSMPPPSSGGVHVVQMLNILENFDLAAMGAGSGESLHLLAEVMRYAYADRSKHLGDPGFYNVPVDWITSKSYATEIAQKISREKATLSKEVSPGKAPKYESRDTTHFSIVDAAGNAVSNTYTLNFSFGSGVVAEGAGFILNNEMTDFNAKPGVPDAFGLMGGEANSIKSGKRPLSAMTPTMVFENDNLLLVTGSPGGSRIINTVLQQLVNVIDHGMNIASATHAPRIHHQWQPDQLDYEASLNPDTVAILKQKGHQMNQSGTMGSLQSIMFENGEIKGSADPRRPGAGVSASHYTAGAAQ